MRYLKSYNQHYGNLKGLKLYESVTMGLTNEEKEIFNYILGIDDNNYDRLTESIFSDVMDRLKSIAKKGVLTATIFSTLMSTPAFSNSYNQLTPEQKMEVQNLVKGGEVNKDKEVEYSTNKVDRSNVITVDLGSYFKSGESKIDITSKETMMSQLKPISDFIKQNGGNVKVTIVSSESRVPNRDSETKERLGEGVLAQRRYDTAKSVLEDYIKTLGVNGVSIEKEILVGGPKYMGDDVNQEKYKDHQFVKIKVTAQDDFWKFTRVEKGKQATKENGYVGATYEFKVRQGSGVIKLDPGSIPDRLKVFADGVEIGDTGFFANKEHKYKEFKYVPLYVYSLTKMYNENPKSEAIEGVETVQIKSVQDLKNLMLNDMSYDINTDQTTRSEITNPYKELLNMAKTAETTGKPVTIAIYGLKDVSVPVTLTKANKKVSVKVYSPVVNTEFSVSTVASGGSK